MQMYTLEQIRTQLQDRRLGMIVKATGIHYNTLKDIRDNADANPTYKVLALLNDYLEATNAD
jgi:hypothetical protein